VILYSRYVSQLVYRRISLIYIVFISSSHSSLVNSLLNNHLYYKVYCILIQKHTHITDRPTLKQPLNSFTDFQDSASV